MKNIPDAVLIATGPDGREWLVATIVGFRSTGPKDGQPGKSVPMYAVRWQPMNLDAATQAATNVLCDTQGAIPVGPVKAISIIPTNPE